MAVNLYKFILRITCTRFFFFLESDEKNIDILLSLKQYCSLSYFWNSSFSTQSPHIYLSVNILENQTNCTLHLSVSLKNNYFKDIFSTFLIDITDLGEKIEVVNQLIYLASISASSISITSVKWNHTPSIPTCNAEARKLSICLHFRTGV